MGQSTAAPTQNSALIQAEQPSKEALSGREYSAAIHLILYGVSIALPLLLVLGFLLERSIQAERTQVEERIARAAGDVTRSLDRDFDRQHLILQTLATSRTLEEQDWPGFYEQAQASLQGRAYIVLTDRAGRQLVNTYLPYGQQPPYTGDPETLKRIATTRTMVISDVFTSLVVQKPVYNISIPITLGGELSNVLSLGLLPENVLEVVSELHGEPSWVTTVADSHDVIVARSHDHEKFVGTKLPASFREAKGKAVSPAIGLDAGEAVLRTITQSNLSGWIVAIDVPVAVADATERRAFWLLGGISGVAIIFAMSLGVVVARGMSRPLIALEHAAAALGRGQEFQMPPARLREANSLARALHAAAEQLLARSKALGESEKRLSTVLDTIPLGVGLVDHHGRTMISNRAYEEFVPDLLPSQDDLRHSLWEAYDERGARMSRSDYPGAKALSGKRVWPGYDFLYHGDAKRGAYWTRVGALPLQDDLGKVTGAIVVIEDISDRKTAEERFRLAVEAAPNGMILTREDGVIALANKQTESLFGYTREELLGKKIEMLLPESARDAHLKHRGSYVQKPIARLMGAGRELLARRKDGSLVPVEIGLNPVATSSGTMVLSAIVDITDRLALKNSQDLLVHELEHRTRNILGIAQALANRTLDDAKSFTEAKLVIAGRLQALGHAYSTLAKRNWFEASLREIIDRQLAGMSARIEIAGCELSITPSAAQQFALIVHELLTNALEYGALSTSEGRVRISGETTLRGGDATFHFSWHERGGPIVGKPTRKGFGTVLLVESARGWADDVQADYSHGGFTYRLVIRLDKVQGSPARV